MSDQVTETGEPEAPAPTPRHTQADTDVFLRDLIGQLVASVLLLIPIGGLFAWIGVNTVFARLAGVIEPVNYWQGCGIMCLLVVIRMALRGFWR